MQKESIWRHGTLASICSCFLFFFSFLKERARPSSVIAALQVIWAKGHCNRDVPRNGREHQNRNGNWQEELGKAKSFQLRETVREEVSECKRIPSLPTSQPPPSVLPPHPTRGDGRRNLASHLVANQSVV